MASFASSATTGGAFKHAWTNITLWLVRCSVIACSTLQYIVSPHCRLQSAMQVLGHMSYGGRNLAPFFRRDT